MNLVLITIDCLRADHVGFMGYQRPTTPNLDRLAAESIVFDKAQVAGSPTYFSFPSILSSRYPVVLARQALGLPKGSATLSICLKKAGYSTAGFTSGNLYVSAHQGYKAGFDTWEDWCSGSLLDQPDSLPGEQGARSTSLVKKAVRGMAGRVPGGRRIYDELGFRYGYWRTARQQAGRWDEQRKYPPAAEVTDRALDWLRAHSTPPFFLWIHYMDPHAPRCPTAESLDCLGAAHVDRKRQFFLNSIWLRTDVSAGYFNRYRKDLLSCYDAGIRDVDAQIDRLWSQLGASGQREQTLLAVLGDHGEEFLEHGRLGHTPPRLYEELTHVPVLLHVPWVGARRVAWPFSLIDLSPTLLQALSIPIPESFQGAARWEQVRDGKAWQAATISEAVKGCREPWHDGSGTGPRIIAIREGPYKLVFDFGEGREEWFDLERDPGERFPLPSENANAARRALLRGIREHLRAERAANDRDNQLQSRLDAMRRELRRS